MSEPFKIYEQWRAVTLEKDGPGYLFPQKFTSYVRDTYVRPAVYRWRVFPAQSGKNEEVYIGEAEILTRRAQGLLRARKVSEAEGKTDYRLRKYFDDQLCRGRCVSLEWLDFAPFEIDCVRFEARELWDPFKRKCIENLALCLAVERQMEILNVYADPINKVFKKFLGMNISAKRFREAVEQISHSKANWSSP